MGARVSTGIMEEILKDLYPQKPSRGMEQALNNVSRYMDSLRLPSDHELIQYSIEQLGPTQKKVITARLNDPSQTYTALAKALNCSHQNIRRAYNRALHSLRQILEGYRYIQLQRQQSPNSLSQSL